MFTVLSYCKTCLMKKYFKTKFNNFSLTLRSCSDVDPTLCTLGYHKMHCCQSCCIIKSYILNAVMTRFRLYCLYSLSRFQLYCFASYYDAVLNVNYVFVVEYCSLSFVIYVFTENVYRIILL